MRLLPVALIVLSGYLGAQNWTPTIILPKISTGFIRNIDMGCYNDSIIFVAWDQDTNNNFETDIIYIIKYYQGSWSVPYAISSPNIKSSYPKFFYDLTDSLHLVWGEKTTASLGRINSIRHSCWNGTIWSYPDTLVVNDSIEEGCYNFCFDQNHNLHLIYGISGPPDPRKELRYKWRQNSIWHDPFELWGGCDFNALFGNDSVLHVAYQSAAEINNHNNDLFYEYLDSTGGIWHGPYVIHYSDLLDTLSFWPMLAIDTLRNLHCFWGEDVNADLFPEDILTSYIADSINWSSPQNVTQDISNKYYIACPSVIVDNFNYIHIGLGYYNSSSIDTGIVVYRYNNGSNWSSPYIISRSLAVNTGIKLLTDDINRLNIAWIADTLNDRRICYRYKDLLGIVEEKTRFKNKIISCDITPNPTKGNCYLHITMTKPGLREISIYNTTGRLLSKIASDFLEGGEYKYSIVIDYLSSGIYYLRVNTGYEIITKKIILIK